MIRRLTRLTRHPDPVPPGGDGDEARRALDEAAAAAGRAWAAKPGTEQSGGGFKDWTWLGMGKRD